MRYASALIVLLAFACSTEPGERRAFTPSAEFVGWTHRGVDGSDRSVGLVVNRSSATARAVFVKLNRSGATWGARTEPLDLAPGDSATVTIGGTPASVVAVCWYGASGDRVCWP